MKELALPIILALVAMAVFVWLWRRGSFLQISNYFRETQEELKKCTWPTWDELKGSTLVVMLAIAMLGVFTIAVDRVIYLIVVTIV
jgi:preprotein translocase subunit SecE